MTTSGKRQVSYLGQLAWGMKMRPPQEKASELPRTTSLGYEDETTSGKGKRTTLDNQIGHEDEENDVYITILSGMCDALVSRGQLMYK